MSHLLNDASSFADDAIDGFVAANADVVVRVQGGVVRSSVTPPGQVAVVIGGGSGHYPAFAGLVGTGLAHGAAMGNVFASPSAHQVHAVAAAAAADAGVLLSYGNYAGDVLNFDEAQERLRAQGVPCRTVVVTDDISSAPATEAGRRRGVAGGLAVFRVASWAAEQGRDLDAVWELATRANARTRTLGVAFSGCTLPGASSPLFTVPAGRMAVGLGIHGEPGIEERPLPTADELARMLVGQLLAERPADVPSTGGARVAVVLNGLGSVKYEELFVTYSSVARLLGEAGVVVVDPDVGELVTSFEMAGVSLTLFWLDDELERAWTSPAAASAYRKGRAPDAPPRRDDAVLHDLAPVAAAGSAPSQAAARRVVAAVEAVRRVIEDTEDELGRLDAVAGDGDHGIGMARGVAAAGDAAAAAAAAGAGAGSTLLAAADAWADRGGGTSGALWGLGLRALAERLGDEAAPTADVVAQGVQAAAAAIARAGKAEVGDKTMLDALVPFADLLSERVAAGAPLAGAARAAAEHATTCAQLTAALLPRTGRARTHSHKSVGTPDPGAVSLALAATAVAALPAATEEDAHVN